MSAGFVKFDPFAPSHDQCAPPSKAPKPPKVGAGDDASDENFRTLATLGGVPPAFPPPMSVTDWHYLYDQRAAFLEYDCGADRESAERAALALCVCRFAWRNPPLRRQEWLCQHCGEYVDRDEAVPAVFFDGGGRHLHADCVTPFRLSWISAALAALDRMGIPGAIKGGAA